MFMAIVHITDATMPSPKGIITIKFDKRDALAYENAALSQAGGFEAHAAEEQAAKVAKTPSGNTQSKPPVPKLPTSSTPRPLWQRKARMLPQGQTSLPPIFRRMTRREP
jgi:hypothetical protein